MARKKMMYNKGGVKKKQMGGVQSPRSVDSFIEPSVERPFADQGMIQTPKSSFVAAKGGVRKLKQEQRKERKLKKRTDRKADKQAIKTLKQSSRNVRRDRVNDAGEDVRMSIADRIADRRATNKASRIFRKQERKARNIVNKADRIEDRGERQALKKANKQKKVDAVNKKLNILNQSESSSVKTTFTVKKDDTKEETNKNKTTTTKKTEEKKETFSQAYRRNRDAGEKTFMWNGKKYTTESKSEKAKRTKSKTTSKTTYDPSKDMGGKGVLKPESDIVYNKIMPKVSQAKEGEYYQSSQQVGGGGGIKYQFKNGKYVPVNAEEKKKHDAAVKNKNKTKTKTKSTVSSTPKYGDPDYINPYPGDNTGSVGFGFKKGGYRRRGGKR